MCDFSSIENQSVASRYSFSSTADLVMLYTSHVLSFIKYRIAGIHFALTRMLNDIHDIQLRFLQQICLVGSFGLHGILTWHRCRHEGILLCWGAFIEPLRYNARLLSGSSSAKKQCNARRQRDVGPTRAVNLSSGQRVGILK